MKKIFLFLLSVLLLGSPSTILMGEDESKEIAQEETLSENEQELNEQELVEAIKQKLEEVEANVSEEVSKPEEDNEKVEPTPVTEPTPVVQVMTTKMMWQWIEDELLLGPEYASAFLFPAKGLGAIGALWALERNLQVGNGPSFVTPRNWVNTIREKIWKKGNFSGFTHKVLLAVGAFAGYKLTNWAIETFLYGFALNGFLHQYPKINRSKTPESLRPYFDKEYEVFVKGGFSYIMKRSKKVTNFVKMAVKMRKKGVAF